MKPNRYVHMLCAFGAALALTACSDRPASPTAPSTVDARTAAATSETSGATTQNGGVTIASAPAPSPATANFEVRFMTDMIDHHQMAIEMAQICVQKAVHEELRSMCQNIIATQSREIQQMQSWLQQWYGITYQPTMRPGDQKMLERLASLSGAEFEIAFMEMMIKHHEKAIKEARHCLDKAAHAELRELCEDIITTQSAEIAQLQTWLCQWYGECR